jgi:GH15 family glucan-1,4-alpha-glucosidase
MGAMAPPVPALDQAAYGNGRVLALVAPDSGIDWLCLPRFDSPSVFARILDREKGGTFAFLHRGALLQGEIAYERNTNVVRTRFEAGDAAWELIDFAPRRPRGLALDAPLEIVRILRPLRGTPQLSVRFDPRPGYAETPPRIELAADGIEVLHPAGDLTLWSDVPAPFLLSGEEFTLTRESWFRLAWGRGQTAPTHDGALEDLGLCVAGWRAWARSCALPTFAPEAVLRSALCLELHAHLDTGAIIAAATTSIPEALGTERTWDYRYCWLRDAAFVAEALRRLSHLAEGERFLRYLRDVVQSGPLQPVYGIGGERALAERMLPHLAGFGGNGHVRIGNAASEQLQGDLAGEVILCLETFLCDPRLVHDDLPEYFPLIESLVGRALKAFEEPDTGIWEYRTQLRHHTFSKAMCWVAAQRGAKLARDLGLLPQSESWSAEAARMRETILERGFNRELGFFTQGLDGHNADASNLLLPTLGLLEAKDPRFVSTVRAYERLLVHDGWMLRYVHPDDFGETTSAFSICSFWWAEALALMGELDEAVALFQRLLRSANGVGLFSEDVDPKSGRLLGNFPQAYTHVGLIHAAMTIGELLEARDGRVRAWS